MKFKPIEMMMERVENNGDNDTTLFNELLFAGEFITKITTAALVASIEDEKDGHRYRFLYRLVRADGIGSWADSIDAMCTGTVYQHLSIDDSTRRVC